MVGPRGKRSFRPSFVSLGFVRLFCFLCFSLFSLGYVLMKRDDPYESPYESKLLWITPRSGGFNNQMITLTESLRCAQITGRTAVVPLMYSNVRADTNLKGEGPYPFEDYFDVEALRDLLPAITPTELDDVRLPCTVLHYGTTGHFPATAKRIPRLLKEQYARRYPITLNFLASFTNYTSEYCVDDSICSAVGVVPEREFGTYSVYNRSGQGYNMRESAKLQQIRKALQPSATVKEVASLVLKNIGGRFNAMHIRRGDFTVKCSQLPETCKEFGKEAFLQSAGWISETLRNFTEPNLPLFVSTTHSDECKKLLAGENVRLIFMEDVQVPPNLRWAETRVDVMSLASQVVASRAEEFVGNRFSSYTTEINNMRFFVDSSDRLRFF